MSEGKALSPPHCRPNPGTYSYATRPTARGVSRASRGAGRAAVADAGRLTSVPHWRAKSHGSGAPFRAPLGFHWRRRRTWSDRRLASFGAHQRWISTVSPPGGMRSKPTNTARGTPDLTGKSCGEFCLCALPNCTQGCGVFRPRRSARPRILVRGKPAAKNFGRTFAPRERGRLIFSPLCAAR
jgi:hypothetical protein